MKREVIRIKGSPLLESRKDLDDIILGLLTEKLNNYHYEFEDMSDILREFLNKHAKNRNAGPMTPDMEKAVATVFNYANLFMNVERVYETIKNHESVKAAVLFKKTLGEVDTKPEEA